MVCGCLRGDFGVVPFASFLPVSLFVSTHLLLIVLVIGPISFLLASQKTIVKAQNHRYRFGVTSAAPLVTVPISSVERARFHLDSGHFLCAFSLVSCKHC